MKMANVDSAFEFMFTNPKNEQEVRTLCCCFYPFFIVVFARKISLKSSS